MIKEEGVLVMKGDKAWQETYADGHCTVMGWGDIDTAPIHNPLFCKKTTDVTYKGSSYIPELETARLVKVIRITETQVLP